MDFLPLIIIFAVMMIPMLLLSNRQRKVQRQRQEMVSLLGVGDEVRTHSGFYGLIVESYGNFVVLETESGALLKWDRAAIATKVDAEGAPVAPDAEPTTATEDADALDPQTGGHLDADRDDFLGGDVRSADGSAPVLEEREDVTLRESDPLAPGTTASESSAERLLGDERR